MENNPTALPDSVYPNIPESPLKRVVLIGGGFSGLEFSKLLPDERFQLVMIDRHNYHTFQPLLYQVATAGIEPDSIASPLRQIFEGRKNFYFRMAEVQEVRAEENMVRTNIGDFRYDILVISVGSKTNYFGNTDIPKVSFQLKQVPQALDLRSHLLQNFERAVLVNDQEELEGLMDYVVVGGGPTGVELAGALAELRNHVLPKDFPELDFKRMNIYLLEGGPKLLGAMSEFASKKSLQYLQEMEVEVRLNTVVQAYDGKYVTLKDGSQIITSTMIWAAGVTGNMIPGLKAECLHKGNRILTDEYNRAKCYDNVYAIGDIAAIVTPEQPNGHPMLAPVAMQQGRELARNLLRQVKGKPMKPFKYFDKGTMATVGRNKAVVDMPGGKIKFGGFIAWMAWMFIHLLYLVGFRSKLIVFVNWVWSYFTYNKGTRLIIRPFVKERHHLASEGAIPAVAPQQRQST